MMPTSLVGVGATVTRLPAWLAPAATVVGAAAGCALVAAVDPNEPGRYPTCPFLALTGRYCPGCGTLRGLHALLRGDVAGAVGMNLLFVAVLPLVVYGWLAWALPRLSRGQLPPLLARTPVAWVVLVVVLAFWALRNVGTSPFLWLAPA